MLAFKMLPAHCKLVVIADIDMQHWPVVLTIPVPYLKTRGWGGGGRAGGWGGGHSLDFRTSKSSAVFHAVPFGILKLDAC